MKTTLNKLILIICLCVVVSSFADVSPHSIPQDIVENFHATLLDIMQNSTTMEYQERFETLTEIIPNTFNIPVISQVILGRYWKELTETQQSEFIALYEELITATYADRFDGFNNEVFSTNTVEQLNRGRLLVKTELNKINGEIISLDYLMSKSNDKWMVISVIADGANDISIKRGEYSDVIKNDGYDALLIKIQKKIDEASN
jgi:phospholipid transport system substrate-binding protein